MMRPIGAKRIALLSGIFLLVATVVSAPAVMDRRAEVEYQRSTTEYEQTQQLFRRAEFLKGKADELLSFTRKTLKELRSRQDADDPKVKAWIAEKEAQLPERYADQDELSSAYWAVAKVKREQEQRLKLLEQAPRLPLTSFYVRLLWAVGAGAAAVAFAAVLMRFSRSK